MEDQMLGFWYIDFVLSYGVYSINAVEAKSRIGPFSATLPLMETHKKSDAVDEYHVYSPATVLLKKPERVGVSEVLELHKAVGPETSDHGLHELVNELVVLLPADALVTQSDVERVF